MPLFTKTDLLDDPDWSDPAEVEPPAERQFELRSTCALNFKFRTAGGALVDTWSADVEVLAKFPPDGGGRPSWAPIGVKAITNAGRYVLEIGGYVRAAVRFTNVAAAGATYVEVFEE